jgi:hypothetical protein
MAGFRLKKATAGQAALKYGIYGAPGAGKSFTALLMAEGLAKVMKKRIAFFDSEHGTDFYCKEVPSRAVHPEAFDFDCLYTRSITETLSAVKQLSFDEYGVIVIDSITHIWQACIESYAGKTTSVGTIPFHQWSKIKRPYLELLSILLSSPMHVIICGRQAIEYETDEESEELKAVGMKMKAESSTAYEPHCLLRLECVRPRKTNEVAQIVCYVEKDRTGVLAGRSFINPNFASLCMPILGLLGGKQAQIPSTEQTAGKDAEALMQQEKERAERSENLRQDFKARITLAADIKTLKKINDELTPQLKSQMTPEHLAEVRDHYFDRKNKLEKPKKEKEVREPGEEDRELTEAEQQALDAQLVV